jgi:poly(A) polymerase
LRLSAKETHFLKNVVFWHLRPGCLAQEGYPTERAIYRFFRDADTEGASIMLLSIADWRATRGKLVDMKKRPAQERVLFRLIEDYFALQKKKTIPPIVNGHDIMKKFHLQPSKLVGKILNAIREEQLLGKISSRLQAFNIAEKLIDTERVK